MGVENNIPEDWIQATLGDVCENISRRFNFQDKETVVFVNTGDVSNGKFLHHNKISKEGLPGQAKKAIKIGDILYSEIRPINKRFAIVDFDSQDYVVSTKFMVLKRNDKIDLDFFYLFLKSNKTINAFQSHAEARSGTFPQITFDTISLDEINLPPLPEQKAIGKVLTVYDNKIELLQAQNKTLETMTQTIFKEWFGKYQIEDELPKGWRVGKLGDIAKHVKNNIKPFNNPNKLYHHYSLPAYDDGLRPVNELGSDIKSNKYSVENNSFLVSKLNPFTPRIWTIFNSEDVNICSTEFQVVKPNEDNLFSIIHCLLNSKHFTSNLSQKVKGTSSSHQRVNPEDIFEVDLIIPNKEDLIRFEKLIIPMITKKDINHNNIQSLTKTRDTLLPKLMSGQVRVNNIKQTADA